jgi:hypothetical protein
MISHRDGEFALLLPAVIIFFSQNKERERIKRKNGGCDSFG